VEESVIESVGGESVSVVSVGGSEEEKARESKRECVGESAGESAGESVCENVW